MLNNFTSSQKLINWIKEHESFSPTAYFDDYAGTPDVVEYSIGYGHQIQPGEQYLKTATLTQPEAEAIMKKDLRIWENYVNKYMTVKLNQDQFDSLVNLCYAVGGGGAKKVLDSINRKDPPADTMQIWKNTGVYWQGKKWDNLVNMRNSEIEMFFKSPMFTVFGLLLAAGLIFVGIKLMKG